MIETEDVIVLIESYYNDFVDSNNLVNLTKLGVFIADEIGVSELDEIEDDLTFKIWMYMMDNYREITEDPCGMYDGR